MSIIIPPMKKIKFVDFWQGFRSMENNFTQLLKKFNYKFKVVWKDPDILIYSCFGTNHKNPNYNRCHKVFYTGENYRAQPDADLNLTFDNTSQYNNIRFPLWLLYTHILDKKLELTKKNSPKFCCFVYSNPVQNRIDFFHQLTKYKQVDSGGRLLNNVNQELSFDKLSKLNFQTDYKFCIAFENGCHPGYTTEKILEAYASNCIPIYYGSETITDDFNPETFINGHDFDSTDELIQYVKKVDNNDSLYQSFMNKPIFSKKWQEVLNDPNEEYFRNIIKKLLDTA